MGEITALSVQKITLWLKTPAYKIQPSSIALSLQVQREKSCVMDAIMDFT